jgi:CRISPR-associated protein Cmr1
MHGADGASAELRPASIKGILRFWWRAIHGNLSLKDLHEQEGEIFGSMDKRSSFTLRVIHNLTQENQKIEALPHKPNVVKLYGFKQDQTFEVIISGQNLNLIQNLFILATTLGGFGQRSRRGFGSVQITKIDDMDFTPPKTEQEIKAKIAEINSDFNYKSDVQYPYIKKIDIGQKVNKMDDLLYKISKATSGKCGKHLFKDERMASPIYVSILRFGEEDYRPVITTLNCVSEKYVDFNEMLKRQKAFKEAIL